MQQVLPFLQSDVGKLWLAELTQKPVMPANHLQWASRLRKEVTTEQAQALLETAVLREKAKVKFSRAEEMFFTRPGLEQSTSEPISTYRTQRFVKAGSQTVTDLCCGIGGDALAFAQHLHVVGVDQDKTRLAMARLNVSVYGNGNRFFPVIGDVTQRQVRRADALFLDSARRDEQGKRIFRLADYQPPPLAVWQTWQESVGGNGCLKISPGVDYAELPSDCEVEFVSYKGEVKEGVLWFGSLHSGVKRRATVLPAGLNLTSDGLPVGGVEVARPGHYLYEPDNAIIRAHLVEALAPRLNAYKIDAQIAYLTSDEWHDTPLATRYTVEAHFPFQLKRLRAYLRERNVGEAIIKKRGSPLEPDQLRRQLKLRGTEKRIIFLTKVQDEPTVIVAKATDGGRKREDGQMSE